MFGAQGQAQSRDYAFRIGTICRAEVRMSYFVLFFFMIQVVQIGQAYQSAKLEVIGLQLLFAVGNEFILMATVLCHEFGHGNMSRYLGGQIDHILLWVFGGICFSVRPQGNFDNVKLLRNDLLIVAAGPATHFLQAPLWGLVLWFAFWAVSAASSHEFPPYFPYDNAWQAFLASLNPLYGSSIGQNAVLRLTYHSAGIWLCLFWGLVCSAISLNVSLFLFNVFFPMYPADGAKLLVTGLMFCCGLPPRRAAMVLICTTVPCALLMIGYAVYTFVAGVSHGAGISGMMGSLMGFMAVMGLFEAYKIFQLRKNRQLHTHSLFQTARSWNRREHDGFGYVNRMNQGDFDDDMPLTGGGTCGSLFRSFRPEGGWSCAGCLGCLLPCLFRPGAARDARPGGGGNYPEASGPLEAPFTSSGVPLAGPAPNADEVRNQRLNFLGQMDQRAADRQRTVRSYMDQQYGGGAGPRASAAAAATAPGAQDSAQRPMAPGVAAAGGDGGGGGAAPGESFSAIQMAEGGEPVDGEQHSGGGNV